MRRIYDNDGNWTGEWELTTDREFGMALTVLTVAVNNMDAGHARFKGYELDEALISDGHISESAPDHEVRMERDWAIRYYRVILKDDVFTYVEADDTYGLSENWIIAWTYLQGRAFYIHGLIANVLQAVKAAQFKYPETQYTPQIVMAVAQLVIAGGALQQAVNALLGAIHDQEGNDIPDQETL